MARCKEVKTVNAMLFLDDYSFFKNPGFWVVIIEPRFITLSVHSGFLQRLSMFQTIKVPSIKQIFLPLKSTFDLLTV